MEDRATMDEKIKPLEEAVEEAQQLKLDSRANIFVEEETEEYTKEGSGPCSFDRVYEPTGRIITEKILVGPDLQKREAAKNKLLQIYDSSEWYTARYIAATALGTLKKDIINAWISELETKMQWQNLDYRERQLAKQDMQAWIKYAHIIMGELCYSIGINEDILTRLHQLEKIGIAFAVDRRYTNIFSEK